MLMEKYDFPVCHGGCMTNVSDGRDSACEPAVPRILPVPMLLAYTSSRHTGRLVFASNLWLRLLYLTTQRDYCI